MLVSEILYGDEVYMIAKVRQLRMIDWLLLSDIMLAMTIIFVLPCPAFLLCDWKVLLCCDLLVLFTSMHFLQTAFC